MLALIILFWILNCYESGNDYFLVVLMKSMILFGGLFSAVCSSHTSAIDVVGYQDSHLPVLLISDLQ